MWSYKSAFSYTLSRTCFKNRRKEVSTEKWNVLHMYALDSDFETARSGFINYGQEGLKLAALSPFFVSLRKNFLKRNFLKLFIL